MVLVSGAERFDSPGQILDWDNSRGQFNIQYFGHRCFYKIIQNHFSISDEDLAIVLVKNHKQAKENPNSLSNKTFLLKM